MYVSEFRLEDYPVARRGRPAHRPAAFDAALNTVNVGKFNLCTASIGICEHAMYEAVTHAHNRVLYGKPVTDFPHVRRELTDAYARLVAMKLFSDRAVDYFRSAGPDDRRYLLFNPMTKMKVTTEGEKVIDLLWDVIAAKGFEKDTYFDKAAKDIRGLPKLEGTVHVNLALILKFMPQLPVPTRPTSRPCRPATTPPTTTFLFRQGPARGLGAIRFHDWRAAVRRARRRARTSPASGSRPTGSASCSPPHAPDEEQQPRPRLPARPRPALRAGRLRPADPGAGRADRPRRGPARRDLRRPRPRLLRARRRAARQGRRHRGAGRLGAGARPPPGRRRGALRPRSGRRSRRCPARTR